MRFDRGDLDRPVLERVQPVPVADEELQRAEQRQHADAHVHHGAGFLAMAAGQEGSAADRQHDQRGGQIGRRQHVREAVGEARVEHTLNQ